MSGGSPTYGTGDSHFRTPGDGGGGEAAGGDELGGAGVAEDGSGGSPHNGVGTPSYRAGGIDVPVTTRDVLHRGWATGSAVVAVILGADFEDAAITDIRNAYGSNTTYAGSGTFCLVAILDGSDPDHANALALAETLASEQITALGL